MLNELYNNNVINFIKLIIQMNNYNEDHSLMNNNNSN